METPYRNLGSALEEMTDLDKPILGNLGYTIDSTYNVIDPTDGSRFLVHFEDGSWASVYHRGRAAPTPDLPVWVGIEDGEPVIVKTHAQKMREMAGIYAGAQDVGLHGHARFSGMEYAINTRLFEDMAVRVTSGLEIEVIRGNYYYAGELNWWTTGTLDLAAYLPVDVGQQCWCVVCINTETNPHTLTAFVGENYPSTDILHFSAIPNVTYPTTAIPLAAVRLADDSTDLVERDFVALYSIVGAMGMTSLVVETDLLTVENVTRIIVDGGTLEDQGDGTVLLTVTGGGGGAPDSATYITQTPHAGLSAEQALSALATGHLNNTTGTGVLTSIQDNLAATVPPDATNDDTEGYSISSRWLDLVGQKEYVLLDNSTGAAVWVETGSTSNVEYPKRATLWHDESLATVGNIVEIDAASAIAQGQAYAVIAYQNPAADGDEFTHSFMLRGGTYDLYFLGMNFTNAGIIDWNLDGSSILTGQDWYGATAENILKIETGVVVVGDGLHVLEGVVNDNNVLSTGFFIPLTKLWFFPASD